MSLFASIAREINDARTRHLSIVHIRVTTAGLPGSLTSVPVTPERARVIGRLVAVRDSDGELVAVEADPAWCARSLELLIHPEDWYELLKETDARHGLQVGDRQRPTSVYGVPVSEDP